MLIDQIIQRQECAFRSVLINKILDTTRTDDVWNLARSKHQVQCFCLTGVLTVGTHVCADGDIFKVNVSQGSCRLLNRPVFFVYRIPLVVHLDT